MKRTLLGLLVVAIGFACTAWGQDPADQEEGPGRGVARISVMNGDVSVRRGDSGELVAAALNAPLAAEDQLLTGPDSRAEVQFDWANMVRLAASSEVRLAELDNGRYQLQVARGLVTFSVLRDSNAQVEISTPVVSVRPVKNGSYRIAVREDGTTEITVRSGEAEIFTPRGSETLGAGRTMVARGTAADPEFQVVQAVALDEWDRWNDNRDRTLAASRSYDYVSRDIYGAEDLDSYGSWRNDPTYGYTWYPRVAYDWAPYQDGRWSWLDWYGWNWVSYDPWGWAPYHYGRWFYTNNLGWGWCPGDRFGRNYWSPGLVAFVGWDSWGGIRGGLGFGGIGWIPLAPHERYYPWYGNRFYAGYRNGGRFGNGINLVNDFNFNGYRNARVRNGITGIDGQGFVSGRRGTAVQVGNGQLGRASLVRGMLPVTPGRESLRVSDRAVRTNGGAPQSRNDGRFFSRQQPARVDRVPFEDQRRGIDQVARQTFGGQRSSPAVNAGGQAGRNQGTSGVQRGAASSDTQWGRQAGSGAPAGNRNATGANDRGQAGNSAAMGADRRSQVNGPVSQGNSTATGGNGWRRFGQPLTGAGQGAARAPQDRSSGVGRQAPQSSPSNVQGGGANSNSRDGWRSFGTGSATAGRDARTGNSSPRSMDSGQNSRSNSGSVAPRSASPQSPRSSSPQMNGNGGQSQVRVNPPIVRERAPSSSGSSNYSRSAPGSNSGNYSRPAPSSTYSRPAPSSGGNYSRPAPSPTYSRPAPSGGGGNYSRSAPSPTYSRPAPSGGGGNYSRSAPSPTYSRPAPSGGGNYSRSAPSSTYSRPAPSGGGGNYSRPAPGGGGSYSRSAPSSGGGSRPAPSSGGGNRSTPSSGGGNRRR